MRGISWFFMIGLGLSWVAEARQTSPKWDVGGTVGLLSANPAPTDDPSARRGDDFLGPTVIGPASLGEMVWQFYDNAWVHPYVFAGIGYDNERRETFVPPQFYYPDPRTPGAPLVAAPSSTTSPDTIHRVGINAGFGAKIYLSHNGFFNAALLISHARPARTASIVGGFGIDF